MTAASHSGVGFVLLGRRGTIAPRNGAGFFLLLKEGNGCATFLFFAREKEMCRARYKEKSA